ncbi:hypothetical protein NQ117_16570 [Paenibacillus sp. SC116]|uniref:hypothetical protein n=1 Tax=Paenibacillus sp. SC116 TaxID=2968986 RepID=UPI00215A7797|nr:hypothetical protein [Paenibacillus sp. SC116]MCR8845300.1 hypothetical protein [Paenibacillus sp. SC116]
MNRKDGYNKDVKGKIGGLDVVKDDFNAEFVINKAGAKIYKDLARHCILEIPTLKNQAGNGKVYEVLSVGVMSGIPIATVKIGGLPVTFRLPPDLIGWCQHSMGIAMQGVRLFPTKVEFGQLNGRHYAELI